MSGLGDLLYLHFVGIPKKVIKIVLFLQYELVGELFSEQADGPAPSKRQRGVVVRAAKQQPKGAAAQKSHKQTVGSQVSVYLCGNLHACYFLQFFSYFGYKLSHTRKCQFMVHAQST